MMIAMMLTAMMTTWTEHQQKINEVMVSLECSLSRGLGGSRNKVCLQPTESRCWPTELHWEASRWDGSHEEGMKFTWSEPVLWSGCAGNWHACNLILFFFWIMPVCWLAITRYFLHSDPRVVGSDGGGEGFGGLYTIGFYCYFPKGTSQLTILHYWIYIYKYIYLSTYIYHLYL